MNRIEYVDKLKGLCILFMVMGHVMQMSLDLGDTTFNKFYSSFHMPVFFFLSGLFAYKHFKEWNSSELAKFIMNKAKRLLLPFISIGSLYVIYFRINYLDFIDGSFYGYWFLPALFLCMLLDAGLSCMLKTVNRKSIPIDFLRIGLTLVLLFSLFYMTKCSYVRGALYHYLFFAMGIMTAQHHCMKSKIYASNGLFTLAIILYAVLWVVSMPFGFNLIAFFSIIILVNFFYRHSPLIPNLFVQLGKYSLEIYVFHRFFIPSLLPLKDVLISYQPFDKSENFILFAIISLIISLPICYISIYMSNIIRHSCVLRKICFGK